MDLFLPMIGVGLVTSIHCVAMCGTMVCSYAIKGVPAKTWWGRIIPHVAYHGPKIVSYVAVGLLLGSIGAAFDIGPVRGYVTLFAGLFMLFLGLQMTGKFPALQRFTIRSPRFLTNVLAKNRKKAMREAKEGHANLLTPVTFGLMTGFMPCGPLQAAQLAAAGTGSPIDGAMAMFGFGLGTMPLMFAFGTVSGVLGQRFKHRMMVVGAIIIVFLGFVMLDRGAMLVGSPITAQSAKAYFFGAPAVDYPSEFDIDENGVVEIPLTISAIRFDPNVLVLPDDEPVRLVVDRQEDDICSDQLAIPQLGILEDLTPFGTTVIDLPPTAGGQYTLTCQMGMMAGVVQVGKPPLVSRGTAPPALALITAFAIWVYVRRRRVTRTASENSASQVVAKGPALVLGYTPLQILQLLALLALAAIAGLMAGGLFGT